jgi:voltage-gated potassium channel Kch
MSEETLETADPTKNLIWRKWRHRLRTFWRECVQERWRDYRWFVIGGMWLVALSLGYVGFARHFATLGEMRSAGDLFYLTLQLFVLESGSVSGPKGWELELARLLAPAVATYTAVQALAEIFYQQLQLVRARFIKDHVVICGLGRKGYLLAQGFRQRGDRVVVIEQDEDNDLIEQCREQGTIVLIGNATNQELLRQARVQRTKYVVSVCGDDGANAEVAVHAQELVGDHQGKALTCILHIVDPQLCDLLREREIEMGKVDAFRLEFFNVFDSGARALLNEYPAFSETQSRRAHLLVVGLGQMGESLVVHAARSWHARHTPTGERLRMTIIDREAERKTQSLCLRYPQLGKVCELVAQPMDIHWPEFQRAEFLFDPDGHCDMTIVYVCLDDDSLGLSAALALRQRVREERIPVVVRMEQDAGLATLLGGADGSGSGFENLHAFGLLDRTCKPDLLLGGTHEIIARAIHKGYVGYRQKLDETPQPDPAMVPWEELTEEFRESCRRQADHIGAKLKAVGCGLAPLSDWDAELFEFKPEEVEQMARMEHQRWMAERRREGWTTGPRDSRNRTNPNLVPWEELPEEIKELNRDMVCGFSAFLAKVGLQTYRL